MTSPVTPTLVHSARDGAHFQPHYEPQGRSGHWSALIDGKVFMWGGYFRSSGTPDDHCSFVDIYDPASQKWTQQKTSGSPPQGIHGAACVGIALSLNTFAGGNPKAGEYYNSIHQLDTQNLIWTEMMAKNSQEAPMKKVNASMVSYSDSLLVTIGGYGKLPENPQPYVDYIADIKQSYEGLGWTNELGVFNLTSRTWSWPSTTGGRPPPCQGHSCTKVDQSRAVVYGGEQLYKCVPNYIHILDMQSWVWNTVTGGAPDQPWPAARVLHSAMSLYEAESGVIDPALLVMWGEGENEHIFSDSWIFIVNAQQWRKMVLPDSLRGRFLHTTTLLHTDDTQKHLVVHGGLDETSEDNAYLDTLVPVADTTIIEIDSSGSSGDWVVTDIIPSSQLGYLTEKDSLTLDDIVKTEPKKAESPPHLEEEPQSPEVKDTTEQRQERDEKAEEVVPAEKMRQLQLAYNQLHDEYEELVDYIIINESDDSTPYEQQNQMSEPLLKSQETIIEATENVKKTQYLRGVEVIAETQFVIKGRHSQTFEWKGHGLKLSVPEDVLPSDQLECVIDLKASFAGQFEFPKGSQLVSPIYWLCCRQKFQHSVTLEINHCAAIQSQAECSYLRFIAAKCSQKELPYKFKLLSKGVFNPGSSYGSIEVKQFSLYGTIIDPTVEQTDQFIQPPSRQYFAQIYYLVKGVNKWQLDFVVTWNLEERIEAIHHQYSHSNVEVGPHLEVEFDGKEISLAIPKYGITLENGWTINPLTPPVVSKRQVDSFKPGTRVPSCQLLIEWVKDESPVRLHHIVNLEGAKEPYNYFAINPLIREQSVGEKRKQEVWDRTSDHGGSKQRRLASNEQGIAHSSSGMQPPTLEELLDNVRTTKWFHLGLKLGVREDTLDTIERDRKLDANGALVDILRKWLRECENPTWVALVCAMRQIGEINSAKQLEDKFC